MPSQFKGVAKPDMVVSGTVNSPAASRVRIVYRGAHGEKRDLPVDFARVGGRLHARAGAGAPRGTFVAFVGGEQAARDRLGDCLDVRALETVAGHNPIERCAALYPAVKQYRERLASCHAGIPAADLAAERRTQRCTGPPPPSPVVAIVYGPHGRELGRESYPFPIPAPHPAPVLGTPPYRGQGKGERGRLPVDKDAAGRPVVLVSGRTPDGAPFEYFTHKFERRNGAVYSVCLSHWWPYAPRVGASGFCGPGFPTTKEYGKSWPSEVFAKSFGFLESGEPASAYAALEGFARPDVAEVRVVYKDGKRKRDAPVQFVQVRGELRERVGSREPFGFFVAFVPPSIERYYGPLGTALRAAPRTAGHRGDRLRRPPPGAEPRGASQLGCTARQPMLEPRAPSCELFRQRLHAEPERSAERGAGVRTPRRLRSIAALAALATTAVPTVATAQIPPPSSGRAEGTEAGGHRDLHQDRRVGSDPAANDLRRDPDARALAPGRQEDDDRRRGLWTAYPGPPPARPLSAEGHGS